jgi:hypothetical protein
MNILKSIRYWFGAIIKPRQVINNFKDDPQKLPISLWILLMFSFLYTVTALLLYLGGALPAIDPWMPIPTERYYLYQTLWTIPWGFATAILMAGIAHVMAVLGREGGGTFEDALMMVTIAWVIPSFVLMWLPETFLAPFFSGLPWPEWVEVVRLSILAPIWQVALTVLGARITYRTGWVRAVSIALVTTAASFLMFLPFMR